MEPLLKLNESQSCLLNLLCTPALWLLSGEGGCSVEGPKEIKSQTRAILETVNTLYSILLLSTFPKDDHIKWITSKSTSHTILILSSLVSEFWQRIQMQQKTELVLFLFFFGWGGGGVGVGGKGGQGKGMGWPASGNNYFHEPNWRFYWTASCSAILNNLKECPMTSMIRTDVHLGNHFILYKFLCNII